MNNAYDTDCVGGKIWMFFLRVCVEPVSLKDIEYLGRMLYNQLNTIKFLSTTLYKIIFVSTKTFHAAKELVFHLHNR